MRKIRIGNDIRLKLKIEPNTQAGFDKIDEFDQSSVKQLRCYLINTSLFEPKEKIGPKPFMRVGFPEFYNPQHHNINCAGFPSYHMMPANLHNYDRFMPDFHSFHWWPGFRGFGLHPEHFHDHCMHIQHGPKPVPTCCDCECEHKCDECEMLPYYLADSEVLAEKNTFSCIFPAKEQIACGIYKLVVVLKVYEEGWGRHNIRTYTIDKGDVFELVNTAEGESGAITIDTDRSDFASGERENVFSTIYLEANSLTVAAGSETKIGSTDANGVDYNIYAIIKDGSTVIYNPYDWHFPSLKFTSSNENYLTVTKSGTLVAKDIEDVEETVTVSVTDIDGKMEPFIFTVTVKPLDGIKIGFDYADDVAQMTADNSNLLDYRVRDGVYQIPNIYNGAYLWVFSQRRIQYIKGVEGNNEIAAELSSGFRVPMTNAVIKDGYFCYRSAAPILRGDMTIKIKFA